MTNQKIEETGTEYVEKIEIDKSSSFNDGGSDNEKSTLDPYAPVVKSEAERRFVKKLNWTLLPLAWAIVFIQFADKSVLAKAAVLGMLTDIHISISQYSLLGSIFYVGYIAYQFPNSYLIQRLPINKYLGTILVLWGISVLGTAFCVNYSQLLVCRILLGFFEASTYPCLLLILSSLYRRQEQSASLGFLWMCNATGNIFAVIVTVAIIKTLDGAYGIGLWRWNYIIFGVMTIVVGILTYFFLVDGPHSKLLRLTEEEEKIVEERTQDNAVVKEKNVKVHHYWEALREPRFYLIMIASTASTLPTGGLVVFSTPFIKTLGFDVLESIVLNIPNSVMSILFNFLAIYLHRKTGKFSATVTACGVIAMIGCLLLVVLPHTGVKLIGYYLASANAGFYVVILTIVSSDVSGYSKKVFYNGAMMIAFTLGSFIGPFVMLENEAPSYRTGMIVFTVCNVVVILCILLTIHLMYRVNQQRLAAGVIKTNAYLDLTDREDSNFIYKL